MALATAGGVGFAPLAPGTAGSALAIAIFVLLSPMHPALLGLTWAGLLFLGIWAADGAERAFGREDDRRIVIDEVVGQLLTFAPLLLAGPLEPPHAASVLVTGFVVFRVFDVWKPGPVRWTERRFRGGTGVMLDDVVAGLLAALVLAGLLMLAALTDALPGFGSPGGSGP